MEQLDLLKLVVRTLESLGIRYAIVGSYGSAAWGEPRFTYDIDVVVALSGSDADRLVGAFPSDEFYVSPEAAREAVGRGGQFNLIHPDSGHKVDFMIAGKGKWERGQLARGQVVKIAEGLEACVGAPEDIIISKMLYYQEGGSEKHLRDIAGILKVSGEKVDRAYVERWARELGVMEIWQAVLNRVGQ